MSTQSKLLASLLTASILLSSSLSAQEKKDEKKDQPSATFYVSLQLIRTDGSQIFIERDLPDPKGKPVSQVYTVMVPVQKTVVKDGKPVVVTTYITEQRTRMTRPTIRRSMSVPKNQVFKDSEGTKIPLDKLIGKLGMGGGKYVVQVPAGQTISPALMKTFAKDTIFLHFETPKKKNP